MITISGSFMNYLGTMGLMIWFKISICDWFYLLFVRFTRKSFGQSPFRKGKKVIKTKCGYAAKREKRVNNLSRSRTTTTTPTPPSMINRTTTTTTPLTLRCEKNSRKKNKSWFLKFVNFYFLQNTKRNFR